MILVGLTGSIGMGKSTTAAMFRDAGVPVYDADAAVRDLYQAGGAAVGPVGAAFAGVVKDEAIDREALRQQVLGDPQALARLNAIVHPAVRRKMLAEKEELIRSGAKTVVLDIPLLFESGLTDWVDKVLVVYVDDDVQLRRLMARNGFTEEEAIARIRAQWPLEEKVKRADAVIDNNGTVEQTRRQLLSILQQWDALEK